MLSLVRSSWGVGSRVLANLVMPDRYDEKVFARFQRQAADAPVAAGFLQQMYDADVTDQLPRVRQPTLVLHYADDPAVPLVGGRQVADGIAERQAPRPEGGLPPASFARRRTDRGGDRVLVPSAAPVRSVSSRSGDSNLKGRRATLLR